MEIIIASDTHRRNERLLQLEQMYPKAGLYLFAGDWGTDPARYDHWIGVPGNNDFMYVSDPSQWTRIVCAEGHRILLNHSHRFDAGRRKEALARLAKEQDCQIVIYGHTHVADISWQDDILLINPGSLWRSRNGKLPSYCVLQLEKDRIDAEIRYWN